MEVYYIFEELAGLAALEDSSNTVHINSVNMIIYFKF